MSAIRTLSGGKRKSNGHTKTVHDTVDGAHTSIRLSFAQLAKAQIPLERNGPTAVYRRFRERLAHGRIAGPRPVLNCVLQRPAEWI